jgi:hypothetical protein
MMIKTAARIFFILLYVVSYNLFPGEEPGKKTGIETNTGPGPSLGKIQVLSTSALKIPEEYTRGRFLKDGDQLAFEAPEKFDPAAINRNLKRNMRLSKYIVCNKQGEIIKKYDRVLMWGYGPLMLQFNAVYSLVLVNLENNYQRIIKIEVDRLNNININPFNKTIIYTYEYSNRVYEYNILHRRSRLLVELMHSDLLILFQLTPNELIYVSPKVSANFKSRYDTDPTYSIEVPVYLANLKRERWGELTKISGSGILFHFNEEKQDITFIVEEKGYFKFINSGSVGRHKKINISHLNHDSKDSFEGLILFHSAMNPRGDLLASSRMKIKKNRSSNQINFDFYLITPESKRYTPEAGEIYILDLNGNSKKLTNTPDQIEVLNDWSKKGNEMLYYDYKNKSFHLLELKLGDMSGKKPLKTSADKVKKIMP